MQIQNIIFRYEFGKCLERLRGNKILLTSACLNLEMKMRPGWSIDDYHLIRFDEDCFPFRLNARLCFCYKIYILMYKWKYYCGKEKKCKKIHKLHCHWVPLELTWIDPFLKTLPWKFKNINILQNLKWMSRLFTKYHRKAIQKDGRTWNLLPEKWFVNSFQCYCCPG